MKTFFTVTDIDEERRQSGKLYREFLRVPPMSAGLYVLPAGGTDPQKPHHEDELYYVVRGRAHMRVESKQQTRGDRAPHGEALEEQEVRAGSVIFVAAGVEHRFYDIVEELVLLVVFAPAES